MKLATNDRWMPAITVSDIDQRRLSGLATAAMARIPDLAEELLAELDRATVVPARSLPPNVVRMGSTFEYKSDDGRQRRVTLVFPADADISQGKISVLTPVGTALIGLAAGQPIKSRTRDGREQELTVLYVESETI